MRIKCVLIGYPGSQCIVPASKYLTEKYLPHFDTIYINYKGHINGWSNYLSGFLQYLTDEYIIFALDDYLIADYIDMEKYQSAFAELGGDVKCIKLCQSTPQEHEEYPCTTQYSIWDREYLLHLLFAVNDAWQFEMMGSKLFDKIVLHRPCLNYFTNSSISKRWEGIRLEGLKEEDIKYLKENNYL